MGLHTYVIRVTDDEDEAIRAVAEAQGVDHLEILRAALLDFMENGQKKSKLSTGMQALLRRPPVERATKPNKECAHPFSLRLHVPQGVVCDACGSWL